MASETASDWVQCPVCSSDFAPSKINAHLDRCLLSSVEDPTLTTEDQSGPPNKKSRISCEAVTVLVPGSPDVNRANTFTSSNIKRSAVFSMFQSNKNMVSSHSERNAFSSDQPSAQADVSNGFKRNTPNEGEKDMGRLKSDSPSPAMNVALKVPRTILALQNTDKPLAERMRPNTMEEYFGQNKVVGEHTLLRSLLDSQEIPSLILWGPPGCGKTTLAHIIASASKKKGTARFVKLSATSTSTSEVRDVIKQAQNELRLCKRKTILFIDEIHRFNKSQQDTFLPHVECGTVTLIGATTENPSFQVNAALLSRCRVLVLEKLGVEAMGSILRRAVASLGISVLGRDGSQVADPDEPQDSAQLGSLPGVYIEQAALDTIAHLCDGDARAGLNGLQLAVQARVCTGEGPQTVVVTEEHVKEGLQRSHILYDKAGEEHYNCISALHKSLRGSHESASLYWLGRMLEGGEDPLYVARRLVRFASEDVGLADPSALPQAVAAFQACHFIGMPECEVILAQCAVYLARAPKSVEVYKAYNNVKACLRNHRGPLPSVPLHLRNAPTRLMKDLGYAKDYKYNPAFSAPVEQDYLPQELQGTDFFTWTPADL